MKNRILEFENVQNFRDFGGYESTNGQKIRSGSLYRSAQFGDATEADINRLQALNIRLQADLRRQDERERHGHRWPNQGVQVLYSDKGSAKQAPHVRFFSEIAVNPDQARQWMTDYYREAPYREQHLETFREWFVALSKLENDEAAVVNCAAGKDRTGILCALTHHALGVKRDAIFADYELTNEAVNLGDRLTEMAQRFNQHIGKNYPAAVYQPFVGVDPVFLHAAFASIEEQSGSLDAYLTDALGVKPQQRQTLQDRFLI